MRIVELFKVTYIFLWIDLTLNLKFKIKSLTNMGIVITMFLYFLQATDGKRVLTTLEGRAFPGHRRKPARW